MKGVPPTLPNVWIHLPELTRRRLAVQIARALRATTSARAGDPDVEHPSFR